MASSPRTIKLRRPPVITQQEGPFVPPGAVMDDVDRRWEAICACKPGSFDGRLSHVLGVHRNGHGGASIHTMDCAYRFYAVQNATLDLGVRHLGVKAMTFHQGRVLLGRRSGDVMAYPLMWEFAPGGVLEPGRNPVEALFDELHEETGISTSAGPTPKAIVFDPVVRCWEIVYRLDVGEARLQPRTNEYSDLAWFDPRQLPEPLSPATIQIAALGIDPT